jgi:hypothetical protein
MDISDERNEKKKTLLLRISPELWEDLNRWARDDLRSLNAQIEYVLREAVRKRKGRDRKEE